MHGGEKIGLVTEPEPGPATVKITSEMRPSPGLSMKSYGSTYLPPTSENNSVRGASVQPGGTALLTKSVNPVAIDRARTSLMVALVFTFVLALFQLIASIVSGSFCALVQCASFFAILGNLCFMLFVLNTINSTAAKLETFRRQKPAVLTSLLCLTLAIAVLTFGINELVRYIFTNSIHSFSVRSPTMFLVQSAIAVLAVFFIILVVQGAQNASKGVNELHGPSDNTKAGREKAAKRHTGMQYELMAYARERGLLLRRTFINMHADAHLFALGWLLAQCVLQLTLSIVLFVFGGPTAAFIDVVLSALCMPLAIVMIVMIGNDAVNVLTEGVLRDLDLGQMANSLLAIDGVLGVRHLRVWSLSMDNVSLSVTLGVDPSYDIDLILRQVAEALCPKFDVHEFDVDMETFVRRHSSRRRKLIVFSSEMFGGMEIKSFDDKRFVWLKATDLVRNEFGISGQVINVAVEGERTEHSSSPMFYQAVMVH